MWSKTIKNNNESQRILPIIKSKMTKGDKTARKCATSYSPAVTGMIGLPIILMTMMDAMLNVTTIAALLIIGGVETNPGPTNFGNITLSGTTPIPPYTCN